MRPIERLRALGLQHVEMWKASRYVDPPRSEKAATRLRSKGYQPNPPHKKWKRGDVAPARTPTQEKVVPHPALGMREVVLSVDGHEGDRANIRLDHVKMQVPASAVPFIANDLRGKVRGPRSGNPHIDAVLSGRADFLGKGDDGLAFRVGDVVVKVSTVVPYQPMNGFAYRTPTQALEQAREQHATIGALRVAGVPGLLEERFVEHAGRGFTIKPFVDIPEQLTERQAREAQNIVKALHDRGWILGDEVQVGLREGAIVLYDAGKARRPPADDKYAFEDDADRVRALFYKHGHRFLPGGGETVDRWKHAVRTAEDPVLAWGGKRRAEEHTKLLQHLADEMRAEGTPVDDELHAALAAMARERAAFEDKRTSR